jgi:hypothetical protein
VARPVAPNLNPWRRQPLTIPPDSPGAWLRLALWEGWMGILLCASLTFGARLVMTASDGIATVYDVTNCYATPPIAQPCERIAYNTGTLMAVVNAWCGVLLLAVAAWLIWELWSAVAPKPITDDFLKLLDDSFGRNWHRPRSWPWARVGWAFGFTLVGAVVAVCLGLIVSVVTSPLLTEPTVVHIETTQRFRLSP